jgi:hypothetical protein
MYVESLEADVLGQFACSQRLKDLVPRPDPPVRTELDKGLMEDCLETARDRGIVTTHQRQLEGAEVFSRFHSGNQ